MGLRAKEHKHAKSWFWRYKHSLKRSLLSPPLALQQHAPGKALTNENAKRRKAVALKGLRLTSPSCLKSFIALFDLIKVLVKNIFATYAKSTTQSRIQPANHIAMV